jgi:hypothetical protein
VSRPFTVIDCEQRSESWKAARLGRVTSSVAHCVMAKGRSKGQESAQRRNLRVRLVLERITGQSVERDYVSDAMQEGIDREAEALAMYEAVTGLLVERTGFIQHDALEIGASLDGHVGDFEGVIEAKNPIRATHLSYLQTSRIPDDYYWQMVHAVVVTGAKWADFLSYHPSFPESLRVKLIRVPRDEMPIDAYLTELGMFLKECEQEERNIRELAHQRAVSGVA